MLEREKPKDVPGQPRFNRDQPRNIQNTREIIYALVDHTPFPGADAGELLSGLDRLQAETEAEKVLKAPQVQDARAVVSSMLEKGFIPKESANSFLDRLEDPATAEVLKKYVLPVTNQGTQAATKTVDRRGFLAGALAPGKADLVKRDVPSVISPDSQVTPKGVSRRKFLVGAGATIVGVGLISIFTIEANRQEVIRVEDARVAEAVRAEAARQEAVRKEAARKSAADRLYPGVIERAAVLFGEDFLGEEAIYKMEEKCHAKGIDVKFDIPNIPFHLNISQLEAAKKDEQKGKARMVVLRPEFMTVKGERKPITLLNLYKLFSNTNPFGKGKIFYSHTFSQKWYTQPFEPFTQEDLKTKFALPTKEVVPGSLGKNWHDQEKLIAYGESRREAIEAVWDMILYYGATGKKLLENNSDRTKTRKSDGSLVTIGYFDSDGLGIFSDSSGDSTSNHGVCLSL